MRKSENLRMIMAAALTLVCVMTIAGCGKQQAGAGSGSEQSAQSALEHGAPPLDAPLPLQESPIVFLPDAIPKSRSFFTTPPKERIPLDFLGGAFYTQHKENIILL